MKAMAGAMRLCTNLALACLVVVFLAAPLGACRGNRAPARGPDGFDPNGAPLNAAPGTGGMGGARDDDAGAEPDSPEPAFKPEPGDTKL